LPRDTAFSRRYSVAHWLQLMSASLLAPALILGVILLAGQYRRADQEVEAQLLGAAKGIGLAADREVATSIALLNGLAVSSALSQGRFDDFDRQARASVSQDDGWIVLIDDHQQQVVNTRVPRGSGLPAGGFPAEAWELLEQGRTHVSGLTVSTLLKRPIVAVDRPVVIQGRLYSLSHIREPSAFQQLLGQAELPESWISVVVDGSGRIIARSRSPETTVGRLATADLRMAMQRRPQGVIASRTLEGLPSRLAYTRGSTGWTYVTVVPRRELQTRSLAAAVPAFGAMLGLFIVGFGVARWFAGRLTRSIEALAEAGINADSRAHRHDFIETIGVQEALKAAAEAQIASSERLRLAIDAGRMAPWSVDLTTGEVRSSPELNAMVGLPRNHHPTLEELQSQYAPSELERVNAGFQNAIENGDKYFDAEYRHIRADTGEERWLMLRALIERDSAGAPLEAVGVVLDTTERREAEDRLLLLAREVDHRANNLLAVVQGVVALSDASAVADYKERVLGRLQALAHAHRLLADSRWVGASLTALVHEELRAFAGQEQALVSGPDADLGPAVAQGLAMTLHELATNAAKYGALTSPQGRVEVSWSINAGTATLLWQEHGGPVVRRPTRKGMGTTLLARALKGAANGTVKLEWLESGLRCTLQFPVV